MGIKGDKSPPIYDISQCCSPLLSPLFGVRMSESKKKKKSNIFRLVSLSGLTALVNVNMMANQIKGGAFSFTVKECMRDKIQVAKHLIFENCFMMDMLNDPQ